MLTTAQISQKIPHGESMSVLDTVQSFDSQSIHCQAHLKETNVTALLGADSANGWVLIEYAAQAAALHLGLQAPESGSAPAGYVSQIKQVAISQAELPLQSIDIFAKQLLASEGGTIYRFNIQAENRAPVIEGQLTISFLK